MNNTGQLVRSSWPHRWAVALACVTFPLLWVGGLVTTTDAGMAVPDWPTTYGYNMFLYPWQWWLAAPWDLFVEHGHRMLGATAGILTIAVVVSIWQGDDRHWLRGVALAALASVIVQGVLGGMRVLFDERVLAMFHGCTGPLFFALAVSLAVFTSKRWQDADAGLLQTPSSGEPPRVNFIRRLAVITCILVYLQVVLGAVVRHIPIAAEPATFSAAVRFHLFLAAVLTLHIGLLGWSVFRHARGIKPLAGLASTLGALVALQLTLGAATWIVKFAVPTWAPTWLTNSRGAIQEGGPLQTHVITAHVATGSLLLATSVTLALYVHRLLPRRTDNPIRQSDGQDCPSYNAGDSGRRFEAAL